MDIVDIVKGWILWILCSDEYIVKWWCFKVKLILHTDDMREENKRRTIFGFNEEQKI